jgi:hypothetical protein
MAKDRMKTIFATGEEVPVGQRVSADHYMTEFTVKVRSTGFMSDDALKQVIQQRHEVINIECTDRTMVVREVQRIDH